MEPCALQVHVAYQTSGSIAVWDEDALRICDVVARFDAAVAGGGGSAAHGSGSSSSGENGEGGAAARVAAALRAKKPGEVRWEGGSWAGRGAAAP